MSQTNHDVAGLREIAAGLATEAAAFALQRRTEVFGGLAVNADSSAVRAKTTPTDPVTVVDTETEGLLRRRLAQLRPSDAVLGEEGGGPAYGEGPEGVGDTVTWVLDPIDGTVNFVYGIPAYAVSVAAQVDGVSVAGAVADVAGGRVYSAGRGMGAEVTDERGRHQLRCTAVDELAMALVGTGFGYCARRRARQAQVLAQMLPRIRDVRRIGSAALDLCMVAAGRLDGYYEYGLQPWDSAAGSLIASEAGARVILPPTRTPDAGLVIAAAPGIADELLVALQECGGFEPIED